jgi:hypothetical protein
MSSASSSLLDWISILFCISVSFFFWDFLYHCHFLFNIVNFHPKFIYLSIYGVLCFTLVSILAPISSFICFCVFSYSYFCCLGMSWVPPVCFDWPCLVTSVWNFHWLLAGLLISGCSCGLHWVPWYSLSLFYWSLDLGVHFLHFPLNPLVIYFW